ncbi:GntR family transcriptional regulator, partial [Erysipelotrichaceae bacterium OttesenSCG-928-M19]|nr:GntR family transcriptional regulator [Erysipelotrichaceae bacterium OttesenSCG-928-M19]
PRYQQIAADIASKIADNKYKVGDRIYARSTIASQYGVSAETARRAINLLVDLDIVVSRQGSGVYITSYQNAVKFSNQFSDIETISELRSQVSESVERQIQEFNDFNVILNKLIDQTNRFRYLNPFNPYQIEITSEANCLNMNLNELNFWHNTGATIIAIKREDNLIISPGPYGDFREGDIVYFIGNDDVLLVVENFIYPNK